MRTWPRLKMEFLPRIVQAQVAESRHVGDLARDALPRPLKKQASVQFQASQTGKTGQTCFPS